MNRNTQQEAQLGHNNWPESSHLPIQENGLDYEQIHRDLRVDLDLCGR